MSVVNRLLVSTTLLALASATAHAERIVAVTPLSTMGTEDTSASTKKLTAQLEAALRALPDTKVVAAAAVTQAITRAKKPQLKACERDPACLAELGKLVGATIVVDGEVGGLGEAKVVYLGATDVASGKELRSTTLSIGAKDDPGGGPAGAAVRLLEPDRYRGRLHFVLDVTGATIYVNGSKIALSKQNDLALPVGTQAVRVTHPEYRDFVRFIDVPYDQTTDVAIAMTQYPVIKHDLEGKPINSDRIEYTDPPLWRRWYVVGPAAVGIAIVTGLIVSGLTGGDFPEGVCREVGGGSCPE